MKKRGGWIQTQESNLKRSIALSGKNNPMFGKKHTLATRKKMSASQLKLGDKFTDEWRKNISLSLLGEKHPLWKGDKAGYTSIHGWLRRHFKYPNKCENCNKSKPLEWANIGFYRRLRSDFKALCRQCHYDLDPDDHKGKGKLKLFKKIRGMEVKA